MNIVQLENETDWPLRGSLKLRKMFKIGKCMRKKIAKTINEFVRNNRGASFDTIINPPEENDNYNDYLTLSLFGELCEESARIFWSLVSSLSSFFKLSCFFISNKSHESFLCNTEGSLLI